MCLQLLQISGNTKSIPSLDHVSKLATKVKTTQDVDAENFTQNLDSIHVCDEPHKKDVIDKIFN